MFQRLAIYGAVKARGRNLRRRTRLGPPTPVPGIYAGEGGRGRQDV